MILVAHGIKNKNDANYAQKKGYCFLEVDVAKRIIFTKFTITHGAIPGKLGFGPTLESLLISKYRNKLFLDIKHANYSLRFTSRIVKLLKLSKTKNVKICGTDWKVISNICQQTNSQPFYTLKEINSFEKLTTVLTKIEKPAGFSVRYQLLNKTFVKKLKSEHPNAQIWAWTPDRKNDIEKLKKLKIDGIITDNWRN